MTPAGAARRRLLVVFAVVVATLVAEVVGAWLSGSLALLADAGHLATDAAGIGLSLIATWYASRPFTAARTFGNLRAEILAAVVNGVLLLAVAGFVIVEAVRRLISPPHVTAAVLLVFGAIALAGNGLAVATLVGIQRQSLTLRATFIEVLGDALGAGAVLVAGVLLLTTGFDRADGLAALGIGLFILPRTWRLLGESAAVLLEATPRGVDLEHVRDHILAVSGVVDVHDLHAWTITSGMPVLSAHVVVDGADLADGGVILDRLGACLADHFDVEHCTFQLEPAGHREHERGAHP